MDYLLRNLSIAVPGRKGCNSPHIRCNRKYIGFEIENCFVNVRCFLVCASNVLSRDSAEQWKRMTALIQAVSNLHQSIPLHYIITMHESIGLEYGLDSEMILEHLSRIAKAMRRKMIMYGSWN